MSRRSTRLDTYEAEFAAARFEVITRSGGRCEARTSGCQGRGSHVHHRKLRGQGGGNSLTNLLHLCARCHDLIHSNPEWATTTGFLIPSWGDPETVAVQPNRHPDPGSG